MSEHTSDTLSETLPHSDIEGFNKTYMEGVIGKTYSMLVNPIQTYPNGNMVYTNEFVYVILYHTQDKTKSLSHDNGKRI